MKNRVSPLNPLKGTLRNTDEIYLAFKAELWTKSPLGDLGAGPAL